MKPPVETLRISAQGKDQLTKIRRNTGIEHWNIICRWALCASLREASPPPLYNEKLEGGIEMTWKVFAGNQSDIYAAMIHWRTREDGLTNTPEGLATCLKNHVHRGLGYLASGTTSLSDLPSRWLVF